MVNDTQNSKLDETVKQALDQYEAAYEPSDWRRMERMLDAAPVAHNFPWKYLLNAFVGVAICAAGYLAYSAFKSDKSESKDSQAIEEATKPVVKDPAGIPVSPSPVSTQPAKQEISSPAPMNSAPAEASAALTTRQRVKAKTEIAADSSNELNSNVKVVGMGNEPIFGDMLDSSKGIIGETKEKKETRDAAKKNKGLPVGWNSFMLSNVNPDSLKAYRERTQSADTTKKH